jgi:hypothetical protein
MATTFQGGLIARQKIVPHDGKAAVLAATLLFIHDNLGVKRLKSAGVE